MPIDIPQGPLITPHNPNITGAEWPKFDGIDSVVSAAAKGAEINGRVRNAEARLLQMQLQEKNNETKHDLAILRMAQDNAQFQQSYFLKNKEYLIDKANSDFKIRKYDEGLTDLAAYTSELQKIDPGSETAWNQALDAKSRHPAGASTPGGRRMEFWIGDQYNKKTAAEKTAAASDIKEIDKYIKLWNWQGFKPTSEPLDNPQYWGPAYKTNQEGIPEKDEKGNWVLDPTSKAYMIGRDALGNPHFLTQKKEVIDDYLTRWQRVKSAGRKEQITNQELQIHPYPVDTSGGGGQMQYGSEAQARAAGHRGGETVTVYNPRSGQYEPYVLD